MKKTLLILSLIVLSLGAKAQLPEYLIFQDTMPHTLAEYLHNEARTYLGTPYRYGGKTPKGFDCAGFMRFLYMKVGYELAPSAGGQYPQGKKITDPRKLRLGDLVFWGGRHGGRTSIGHVGMVVEVDTVTGNFRFIHSATHGGVRYDRSTAPYYKSRYVGACRVLPEPPEILPYYRRRVQNTNPCWHVPMTK